MFTIRKVERKTVWQATEPVSLSPLHFSMLKSFPYSGQSNDEKSFLNYIYGLNKDLDYIEKETLLAELDTLGFSETSDSLWKIFDCEMKIYSDSSDDGEDSWLELGEENPKFTDYGGFQMKLKTGD
jgi:hypothetical protein